MALELQFQCYLQHNGGQCVEVSNPKQLCLVLKRAELSLTTRIFRTPRNHDLWLYVLNAINRRSRKRIHNPKRTTFFF